MSDFIKEVSDSSFEKDVLGSDKPVLVDFWAEWCAPCRMLAPTVAAVAEHYGDSASVVKLNVDDNPSTAQRYGIKGGPAWVLGRGGGGGGRGGGAAGGEASARGGGKY